VSLGATNDDPFRAAETPSPWFLKPWVLALWGLTVLLLIATIIYGLVILATGNGGAPATTRPSTSTSSSTAPARTTAPSSTPPSTTTPPAETTTEPSPPVVSPTWTPQQRPHRHWWNGNVPQLPGLPPIHVPGVNP
jgi:cell division septation protein DedD